VRALYLAQYRIKHGVCPTEAKVRFLQKQYKLWYLCRQRKALSTTCLVREYVRICALLSVFVAKFNRLKMYPKNASKLSTQLTRVLHSIFPKRQSRKELEGKSIRARYRYVLS
jgi:hypothetical protein